MKFYFILVVLATMVIERLLRFSWPGEVVVLVPLFLIVGVVGARFFGPALVLAAVYDLVNAELTGGFFVPFAVVFLLFYFLSRWFYVFSDKPVVFKNWRDGLVSWLSALGFFVILETSRNGFFWLAADAKFAGKAVFFNTGWWVIMWQGAAFSILAVFLFCLRKGKQSRLS